MDRKLTTDEYFAEPEAMARRELVWAWCGSRRLGNVYVSPLDVVFDRKKALCSSPT